MPKDTLPRALRIIVQHLKKYKSQSRNTAFIGAVDELVGLIIKTKEEGGLKKKLAICLNYLESLPLREESPFSIFQDKETLGNSLSGSDSRLFPGRKNPVMHKILDKDAMRQLEQATPASPVGLNLDNEQRLQLGGIHVSLMHFYQNFWHYDYPLETGQVMNDVVGHWQNELMRMLPEKKNEACCDFARGFAISGKVGTDFQDESGLSDVRKISDKLDELLSPIIDENQRKQYKTFIMNLGGQAMASLTTDLLSKNDDLYESSNDVQQWAPFKTRDTAEWKMGSDNHPVFNYEIEFCALQAVPKETCLYGQDNGRVVEGSLQDYSEEKRKLDSKVQEPPPLMRIAFQSKLAIETDNPEEIPMVKPRVVSLQLTSYTNKLHPPGRQYEKQVIFDADEKSPKLK